MEQTPLLYGFGIFSLSNEVVGKLYNISMSRCFTVYAVSEDNKVMQCSEIL